MEYAVQVSAQVEPHPAQITLNWVQDATLLPESYTVFKRAAGADSWGDGIVLPGSQTHFIDDKVTVGRAYEYQIVKKTAGYTGYGYIHAGMRVPMTENRGKLLLLVDNTHATELELELNRLQQDIAGDGWTVIRIDVNRDDSVPYVKSLIKSQYDADPANVKAVFLFGHVPVPYSGNIAPDGHYREHEGAWPCDGYYADMDGVWTDETVNVTLANDPRNHNVPGDGKFDQSRFPSPLELMIGRVDLANMPGRLSSGGNATFDSEVELLRNYLNKNHRFRHGGLAVPERGIVGDFFGVRDGEAFAASGWRNFAPFFGASNITVLEQEGTWISTLSSNAHLWAYACGSGSYTSIGGIGSVGVYHDGVTTELVSNNIKAVFTMLYGSWLGDWDSEDNLQRAVLATRDYGLATVWSGRPHWYLQHMALGEPIGFSTLLTQNNQNRGEYQTQRNSCSGWTHIALMGDPTLRMHVVVPPSTVSSHLDGDAVILNWAASPDSVEGYNVYRALDPNGPFTRLNTAPVAGTSYTDSAAAAGGYTYMVRAVKLQASASGTYYNLSQGTFAPALNLPQDIAVATNQPTVAAAASPITRNGMINDDSDRLTPTGATNKTFETGNVIAVPATNALLPGTSIIDNVLLQMPKSGDYGLHILTPTLLELKLINTKAPGAFSVSTWNFVDNAFTFTAPALNQLEVTADGQAIGVTAVGFKRRPLYAPLVNYDLRIENSLYLQLNNPVSDNQTVVVRNPDGSLWSNDRNFEAKTDPLRYSPAIHVNQEGYMPGRSKKAMVGYYIGNLGELSVISSSGFKLVDANSGATVFTGTLVQRADVGYSYQPTPYQKVYEADFTGFNTPGTYRLVVPGMGASLPFDITEGVAMNFARAYALGLYHQRCGTGNALPFTRHTHADCHTRAANIPTSAAEFPFTWSKIAEYANIVNPDNPQSSAPKLTSPSAQLYPFVRIGTIDVSGGHHDAGDYSKYTLNSVALIHYLTFAVDSLPGVKSLDNLGIPESGDGISDLLQEAKWEADFLAKMQDSDGGFYFLVYPHHREYEGNVLPENGDPQLVWPKTSTATASSVAALAEIASSPAFKAAYPQAAAIYMQKAQLGWQFLMNGIAAHGRNGIYQKITHYGDDFGDNDELAWAAASMFAATGDPQYQAKLMEWFPDPTDPATFRWGWWRLFLSYGNAVRNYAFAARSGRLQPHQLNAAYLAKCEAVILAAGDDYALWSKQNAYGTSFPEATKRVRGAGWYFSGEQTFDLTVAYQIEPKPDYMTAILANMNFEGGNNPVNMSYVTGMGWKRERDAVSQYAANDRRIIPPTGQPIGNIQSGFSYLDLYQGSLTALTFPSDNAAYAPHPFYDRWADSWNVSTEYVTFLQARSLATYGFLAAQTSLKTQAWRSAQAQIVIPPGTLSGPITFSLQAEGLDLSDARIVWETRDGEPYLGKTYTFTPKNNGRQWIEAEAQLPDGRRVFAATEFDAVASNVVWVDDELPAGAIAGTDGGDDWNWINGSPAPTSGSLAHDSALAPGTHQHYFRDATATLNVDPGMVLYTYIYLDPANPPSEVMLQWFDGNSWEHRAYWGANNISYGVDGTQSRKRAGDLPAAGQWVQLKVPAKDVGLEGKSVTGMSFTLHGGRATWDAAGLINPAATNSNGGGTDLPIVTVTGADGSAAENVPGVFTFKRTGSLSDAVTVVYSLNDSATASAPAATAGAGTPEVGSVIGVNVVNIPAGASSATVNVAPGLSAEISGGRTVAATITANSGYETGSPSSATLRIAGNTVARPNLSMTASGPGLSWASMPGAVYRIAYKNSLSDANWTYADSSITATSTTSAWSDSEKPPQRFYLIVRIQ